MDLTLIYQNDTPQSVTDYLTDLLIPRKVRHFLRTRRNVWIDGQQVPFHTLIHKGQSIDLHFEDSDYQKPNIQPGDARYIDVLYEDEHLIAVNKPIHMKTHPNQPNENGTLLNHLAAYLSPQATPYVIHRLDMETSGCILFAKNPVILPIMSRLLETKEITRCYEAIATGIIHDDYLTIDAPIGKNRHDKRKRCVDFKHGQNAITHLTTLDRSDTATRVLCQLDTGRTHQIRVHLAHIHHPILGDPLYQKTADRLYLHAFELSFPHPFLHKTITVQTPTPF